MPIHPRHTSQIVTNSIEIFVREYPYDTQAYREWKQWRMQEEGYGVYFWVRNDPLEGRSWGLSVIYGPEEKPTLLLALHNDPAVPGTRTLKAYNAKEDHRIVTFLTSISLTWEASPSGVIMVINRDHLNRQGE